MAATDGAKSQVLMLLQRFWGQAAAGGMQAEKKRNVCCSVFSFFLVVSAVTIQRQGMVTLLQYCTPYETKDVFTVCCSFTIITFYSIITRTITVTDTQSASCVCVCGGFVQLCMCVSVCLEYGCSVLRACLLKREAGKSQ